MMQHKQFEGTASLTALTTGIGQDKVDKEKESVINKEEIP